MQPDVAGDPLGSGTPDSFWSKKLDNPLMAVRERYLFATKTRSSWQDYEDFASTGWTFQGVYFIGGFGVMGWVAPGDYAAAAPDPLVDAAPAIIQHMNADHAEALLLIARHYTGELPDEAAMTAVDRLGFHVRLRSGDRVHGSRVAFPREAATSEEARRVLVEMVRQARNALSARNAL